MKVCLIGDTNVGKTSLALRFVDDEFTDYNRVPYATIGVGFKNKPIALDGKKVKI